MDFFFLDVNKVDVSYFLIIQDIIGVLIVLLGLKLSVLYFLFIVRHGKKFKNIVCLIGSTMIIYSGINIVFVNKGLQTWFISIGFIVVGSLLGRIAYRKL